MEGVVPIAERKKCNKMLRILSEKENGILPSTIGKLPVLWEPQRKDGKMFSFTKIMYVKPGWSSIENQMKW